MKLSDIEFDELKNQLSLCNSRLLMFIIMLANGELMDRQDKNKLIEIS